MEIRNFWVDLENSAGVRVGSGPLRASEWHQTAPLSSSGRFSFQVGIADPNIDVLREKLTAICKYIDMDGNLVTFGGGVIDKITTNIAADGSVHLAIEGNDLIRELTYRSVGALDLSGLAGAGVDNAPTLIMALAPGNWSVTNGSTLQNIYAGFDGESVLSALTRCGEHIGEHWRLGAGRVVEWLGPATAFAASGVRAVQHSNNPAMLEGYKKIAIITALEEVRDAADVISRVIPRGAGNGGAVLTLANATDTPPTGYTLNVALNYVRRDVTETTYDRIERTLDFKEIGPLSNTTADLQAAANMLLQASVEHLRRYGTPPKFYRLSLANVSALLKPGTTIHVVYRKTMNSAVLYDLNDTFNVLEVGSSISAEGAHTSEITISSIDRMPISDSEYLARQIMEAKVLSAHQQLGASVDTLTFRDEMDDGHGASMRFWIGEEYTSIQSALVRFRIQPLRSTVKSIGGESTSTESGGGGTSSAGGGGTSGDGGASTPTSGSTSDGHTHTLNLANSTSGNPVSYASGNINTSGGGTIISNATTADHSHSISIPDHSHSISDHTHDIPAHSHDLTANVLMEYGIFEESGANTLALANLVIKLNGGADLMTSVTNIGNGWYLLDITDALTDDAFRPNQENNEIAITTATAKTARIELQITVRGVVQAINYG